MAFSFKKHSRLSVGTAIISLAFTWYSPNLEAKQEIQFGLGLSTSFLEVNDPNGNTETTASIEYINPLVTIPFFSRNWRLGFGVLYSEYEFNGTDELINQSVEHLAIQSQVQYNLRLGKGFKPWIGIGVGLNKDKFSNRYTIDNDGYLIEEYPNRTENSTSLIGSITNEWALSDSFNFGLTLQYEQTLGNALEGFRVTGSLLY